MKVSLQEVLAFVAVWLLEVLALSMLFVLVLKVQIPTERGLFGWYLIGCLVCQMELQ